MWEHYILSDLGSTQPALPQSFAPPSVLPPFLLLSPDRLLTQDIICFRFYWGFGDEEGNLHCRTAQQTATISCHTFLFFKAFWRPSHCWFSLLGSIILWHFCVRALVRSLSLSPPTSLSASCLFSASLHHSMPFIPSLISFLRGVVLFLFLYHAGGMGRGEALMLSIQRGYQGIFTSKEHISWYELYHLSDIWNSCSIFFLATTLENVS